MRASTPAFVLVLFAAACGSTPETANDACPNGIASGVSVVIGGATAAQAASACAHTNGAAVVVSLPEGFEINVDGTGRTGSLACDYEDGAIAVMDRLDGSRDRWEASPGGGGAEASCTFTVSKADAGGTPITGSFQGNLVRYPLAGGVEVAQVSFTFNIPPVE